MTTEFFKTDDGIYHKIESDYDRNPLDPRKDFDNLGQMVFKKQSRYSLGDIQTDEFAEFFEDELKEIDSDICLEGCIRGVFPDNDNNYMVGNNEIGYRFDKEKFLQDVEASLDNLYSNNNDLFEQVTCGIPLTYSNSYSEHIEIDFEIKNPFLYKTAVEKINEVLSEYNLEDLEVSLHNNIFLRDKLTEKQLFDLWAEKQFFVLPINIFEPSNSNTFLHPGTLNTRTEKWLDGSNIEEITNSGFIYVSKDNEEVQEYLKEHSEEETKQWLENVFKGEIELYSQYVNGEVYTITDSIFNPKTLNWNTQNEVFSYYGTEIEYIKETLGAGKYISQNEIQELENTITPEFIKATGEKFFSEIQECLSDFDGNLLYAQKSVFNAWNREAKTELFPNENKLNALSQFLKDNGCDSPEKTIAFLEKNINPSQQKTFDPFSYEAEKEGYETWLNPNSNKLASNYNSRVSPNHALIIDYQNKRFGILTGADSFSGDSLPNYKKNPLLSGKKFKEKIEKLLSEGFVFEKFTGERAEYVQGKLETFFPNKKKINSKENDYERGM